MKSTVTFSIVYQEIPFKIMIRFWFYSSIFISVILVIEIPASFIKDDWQIFFLENPKLINLFSY